MLMANIVGLIPAFLAGEKFSVISTGFLLETTLTLLCDKQRKTGVVYSAEVVSFPSM